MSCEQCSIQRQKLEKDPYINRRTSPNSGSIRRKDVFIEYSCGCCIHPKFPYDEEKILVKVKNKCPHCDDKGEAHELVIGKTSFTNIRCPNPNCSCPGGRKWIPLEQFISYFIDEY
jgi:hypothetical protein